jgi:tRNA 2-selenouridine synthase SelU
LYVVKRVLKVIEDVWSIDQEPLAFCTWCYACKKYKFLLNKRPSIDNPLLFIRGATRIKSISFR